MAPPPHRPASVYPPAFGAGGGHTRWVVRGWGVNILDDARHCFVLYICKYFVALPLSPLPLLLEEYKWKKDMGGGGGGMIQIE